MTYFPRTRQWGWFTFAAYVPDGTRWGRFVGTASTRQDAETLANKAMRGRVGVNNKGAAVGELGVPGGGCDTAGRDPIEHPSPDGTQDAYSHTGKTNDAGTRR